MVDRVQSSMPITLAIQIASPPYLKRLISDRIAAADRHLGDWLTIARTAKIGLQSIEIRQAAHLSYNHSIELPVISLKHEMVADLIPLTTAIAEI